MPTNTNHQSERKKRKNMRNIKNHHQTNTKRKMMLASTVRCSFAHYPQDCRGFGDGSCVGCLCPMLTLSRCFFRSIFLAVGPVVRQIVVVCEIEVCVDVFISLGRSSLHPVLPFCLVDIVAMQFEKSSVQHPRCFWPSLLPVSRNSSSV